MTTNEIITTTLSIVATVISVVTFVRPLLKTSTLKSKLVDVRVTTDKRFIELTYLFSSVGNVEWYLQEVLLVVWTPKVQVAKPVMNVDVTNVPAIIHPDKVNLITITCSSLPAMFYMEDDTPIKITGLSKDDFELYVQFRIINPKGQSIRYWMEVKELLSTKERNTPHWETVQLNGRNLALANYHVTWNE